MPRLNVICPDCGYKIPWVFNESVFMEELVWHASSHCTYCGYAVEEDDIGPLPEGLRTMLLAEQGVWSLHIHDTGNQKVLILKILREALGLSLSEAGALRNLVPGEVMSGTRAEMERLRMILVRQGVDAVVLPVKS